MNLTRSKKKDLLYVAVAAFFFLTACVLQTVDDYISDWSVKTTIALLTQYIFFGLLAYWTASVISRISDKSICSDRMSTRLNSSHPLSSRMPSSA